MSLRLLALSISAIAIVSPAMAITPDMSVVTSTSALNISAASDQDAVSAGAKKFIDNMGQKAIGFLSNNSLSMTQKESEFRKLLRGSFDMRTIGRFALGRYWNIATPDQQQEYQKLFEDMVVDVYSGRFNDYKGQNFKVSDTRRDGDKDALVTSHIVPDNGQQIRVDWRVRAKDGGYKIVDVIIEGVSMSMTQRSDFSSVIQSGGGDLKVLLTHLRERTRK